MLSFYDVKSLYPYAYLSDKNYYPCGKITMS